jgi:hypothetical protein
MSPKTTKHMIWHHSLDVVDEVMMRSWCVLPIVKPENNLIRCILNFQWNHGTYMLCYVQTIQFI